MPQLQVRIDKDWGCVERSISEWRTTLSTLRHSGRADPASLGRGCKHDAPWLWGPSRQLG
jgi:hypothetical protein